MEDSKMTSMEADALKEIGNIGSGNASIKLSGLINEKINIELTEINIIAAEELSKLFEEDDEKAVVAIFLRVLGDVFGSIATLFQNESALMILELIDKKDRKGLNLDKDAEKKFENIGNDIANSYVNALKDFLAIKIQESDPMVQINKKGIIINFMTNTITQANASDVLLIRTKFLVENQNLKGEFMSLFGLKSIEEFKKTIHQKLGLDG